MEKVKNNYLQTRRMPEQDLLFAGIWIIIGYFISIVVNFVVISFIFNKEDIQFAQLGFFELIHNLFNYGIGFGLGYLGVVAINLENLALLVTVAIVWIVFSFLLVLKIIGLEKMVHIGGFLVVDTASDYATGFAISAVGGTVILSTMSLLSISEVFTWLAIPLWILGLIIVFTVTFGISYYRQEGDVEIYED